jgi:hypothetical protein
LLCAWIRDLKLHRSTLEANGMTAASESMQSGCTQRSIARRLGYRRGDV